MRFYEFGENNERTLMLLPATKCHWKNNFSQAISLLDRDFHVICVSYDGFDESEDSTYPDIIRHDCEHEELLMCFPEQWVSEIKKCTGN